MTATDHPRVGGLITSAAQVRALPHGTVVRTHNGILCETQGVGLATPSWYAQGRMLEAQHLPARVLYVPDEQFPVCLHCGQFIDPEGFAEDGSSNCAASQEGPVDDLGNVPHDPAETTTGPALTVAQDAAIRAEAWAEGYNRASEINEGFHDVERHNPYHANARAETTTTTTEDAGRRLYDALRRAWPEGYADPEDVTDWSYWQAVAEDAGLLATARTRPTRDDISDAIEHSGIAIGTVDAEQAADAVLALLADDARAARIRGGGDR